MRSTILLLASALLAVQVNASLQRVHLSHRAVAKQELDLPNEARGLFEDNDEFEELEGRSTSAFPKLLRQTTMRRHNELRAKHVNTPNLTWSDELATYAKNWAEKCNVDPLEHSTGDTYAESIANYPSLKSAIAGFYSEVSDIDWSDIQYSQGGHFINMIYSLTTEVGCYKQKCGTAYLEVCEYNPPATSDHTLLQKNVHPLKSSS